VRTLEDWGVRGFALGVCFVAVVGILWVVVTVARGLVVFPILVERRLRVLLPFLATEEILMAGVAAGGDRQDLHERIRQHSRAAATAVKAEGRDNPLMQLIAADPAFAAIAGSLPQLLDPKRFVGRAAEQVGEFLARELEPRLRGASGSSGGDLRV
jgi:adenylosuccinate lyase